MTPEELQKLAQQELAYQQQMAEAMQAQYDGIPFFPAQVIQGEGFYSVQVTADVGAFFASEFAKHELYGNGYCWEGIISQLVGQKRKGLVTKVKFDAEAEVCFIACEDENSMNEIAKFIHEELSDKEKFNEVLGSIDKTKLDC